MESDHRTTGAQKREGTGSGPLSTLWSRVSAESALFSESLSSANVVSSKVSIHRDPSNPPQWTQSWI